MPGLSEWSTVETVEGSGTERNPSVLIRPLVAALVAALLAIVGLGTWVYADHHQSSDEGQAIAVVQAWLDAANAHDLLAVRKVSATNWTWESAGRIGRDGPYVGTPLDDQMLVSFRAGFHIQALGDLVALSSTQVEERARVRYTDIDQTGIAQFVLRQDNGSLKVAELIWTT